MLEARKLSAQVEQDPAGKLWSWLSGLVWLATLLVLCSIWIGANYAPPPPDTSQEKTTTAHSQVLTVVANLDALLAPDQELTPELIGQLNAFNAPLTEFGQLAASGLRISADSQDPQTWPGKVNSLVSEIKILSDGQESLTHYFMLREALLGLYKPKGPLNAKLMAEGSSVLSLHKAILEWANAAILPVTSPAVSPAPAIAPAVAAGAVPKITWASLSKGQPLWREIIGLLDVLEQEAKQAEEPARAKAAKETLALLAKNDYVQKIRQADDAWSKMLAAHERLKAATTQLPSVPKVILNSPPWHWSSLAFPGTSTQGVLIALCMVLLNMSVNVAGYVARRNHLKALSERWLTVTQQLELAVRGVDAPLAHAIQRIEALSLEFGPILESLKNMQLAISTPAESPPKTMEAQAWLSALRMQTELEGDLNLIREKLLNIHLQFCSGQTHENLVYDLAFTTEAIQTVFNTARDLGRSVALLKDNLQQVETAGDGQAIEVLIGQVHGLRNSAKRVALTLQELSGRLQVAVEDVPKGRRFEAGQNEDEVGRSHVNQPI